MLPERCPDTPVMMSECGRNTHKGYKHSVVRNSTDVGDNLLPLASRVAALLKSWLQGTHQGAVLPSHLDYYLDEFTFRFNRRTSRLRGSSIFILLLIIIDGS